MLFFKKATVDKEYFKDGRGFFRKWRRQTMSSYYPESKVEINGFTARHYDAKIIQGRIEKSLPFREKFDRIFISFVLHGFPQDVREVIIKNVFKVLRNIFSSRIM